MLDIKRVGIKICAFRKKTHYSQEKLAEKLHISPQAVSKWENGHSLPETSLLPVLAQIFSCSIDDIIMPAYTFDETIEVEKCYDFDQQSEQIAKIAIKLMKDTTVMKIFNEQKMKNNHGGAIEMTARAMEVNTQNTCVATRLAEELTKKIQEMAVNTVELEEIVLNAKNLSMLITEISALSKEVTNGINQINTAISEAENAVQ